MNRLFWRGMLIACVVMLIVLIASVPYTDPESGTYVIIQLAAAHLLVAMVILASFLYFDWNPIRKIFE